MRRRHRGKRPVDQGEPAGSQRGFTPYECIQIYWLHEQGIVQQVLAQTLEVSQATISRSIRRGRDMFHAWDIPRMLAVGSDSECGHRKPIQVGDRIVCCRCFVSGYDAVAAMHVTASDLRRIEGIPEPKEQKEFAERMHGGKKQPKKAKVKSVFSPSTLKAMEADYNAHMAKRATPGATPIPWATILQIIMSILEALGPILAPPAPTPAK